LDQGLVLGCGEFGDEGLEEVLGGGAGGGELRFQLVHQGHQLLHFGHDPALFGEGGAANWSNFSKKVSRVMRMGRPFRAWKLGGWVTWYRSPRWG